MSAEIKKEIQLEIAHVLFIDIVAYSKLSINEQRGAIDELTQVVRGSEQFQRGEATGRLIKIPTGDGMALVFYTSPEAPAQCAIEISRILIEHPRLQLRMGAHSGPVSGVIDVNGHANLAGAGLNIAQRVMVCGDAGHILISKHVAEDLEEYEHWRPLLHELGTCEVKHGARVGVVNLYAGEVGNPQLPKKFQALKKHRARVCWAKLAAALLALATIVAGLAMFSRSRAPLMTAAAAEKSIAVLPFENLSEDKANAYFADGVQDEILTNLAKIADLRVISRTSVMQYKSGIARNLREIGRQLGVAHLLEGNVQRAGGKVRVNAQLIDVRNDAHLWAQTYDRDLADVFAIQSEIAKAIADQLQAKLSPREKSAIERPPTADVTAFDLYSRAKTLNLTAMLTSLSRPNLLEAVELLNQAVERDPSFFQAYCQLAFAHDQLYFLGSDHTPARLALAEAAIQAAFRLRPDAGETHLARAENLYRGYLDYDGARSELEVARQTLPNDPRIFELTGYIDRRQGTHEQALRNLERAVELDPRNYVTLQQISLTYESLHRYSEMAWALDRVLEIKPDDVESKAGRALVELNWKGDTRPMHHLADAIQTHDKSAIPIIADYWFTCAMAERDPVAAEKALTALGETGFNNDSVSLSKPLLQGVVARMLKHDEEQAHAAFTWARTEQEKVVQSQPNYGVPLCVLGLIDAGLGRKEEALKEGRRAVELVPVEKDSINGAHMIEYLAMICAWVGEKDLACQQLAIATRLPGTLSYGQLKLLPYWDPLRSDPCFEKIVASLAPKPANK
jgi:TolB-like protein/class 3 adenylate cyclase/Tfp pilus assembly protein PilF